MQHKLYNIKILNMWWYFTSITIGYIPILNNILKNNKTKNFIMVVYSHLIVEKKIVT